MVDFLYIGQGISPESQSCCCYRHTLIWAVRWIWQHLPSILMNIWWTESVNVINTTHPVHWNCLHVPAISSHHHLELCPNIKIIVITKLPGDRACTSANIGRQLASVFSRTVSSPPHVSHFCVSPSCPNHSPFLPLLSSLPSPGQESSLLHSSTSTSTTTTTTPLFPSSTPRQVILCGHNTVSLAFCNQCFESVALIQALLCWSTCHWEEVVSIASTATVLKGSAVSVVVVISGHPVPTRTSLQDHG